jgi:hypothetical protein
MNNEKSCCETTEQTITRLQEENYKLHEEIKMLHDKLIEYTNMLKNIEYNVNLTVKQINNDDFINFL